MVDAAAATAATPKATWIRLFHERQKFGHCAAHCLNNLLQDKSVATFESLQRIATQLHERDKESGIADGGLWGALFNPYMSQVPLLGYFDINCMVKALKRVNCTVTHHFATAELLIQSSEVKSLLLDDKDTSVQGLIVNVSSKVLAGMMSSSHWFAIVRIPPKQLELLRNSSEADHGTIVHVPAPRAACGIAESPVFVNLDSKLAVPIVYAGPGDLYGFLTRCIQDSNGQVFLVRRTATAASGVGGGGDACK